MKPPHPSRPGMALILAAAFLLAEKSEATSGAKTGLTLSSTAFANGNKIPAKYSCDGDDTSPPLSWSGIPSGTKSLALIVDDPDAPQKTWVHWVLYNLPPDSAGIKQGASLRDLPPGTREGLNDWHRAGYGGPCPPAGRHRYVHKLYALDTMLPDLGKADKAKLEKAMQGHVIDKTELVGTYQR
jgi:Raf kinase inhibitor-like YbhB/YbcL family protein